MAKKKRKPMLDGLVPPPVRRPPKSRFTRPIPARLTQLTVTRLAQAAAEEGCSTSTLIRKAIEEWLLRRDLKKGAEE